MEKPELLSPAGTQASLIAAIESGADSVYFGIKGLNMRHNAGNFDILELHKVMDYLHGKGKKGYLTLNIIVLDNQICKIRKILKTAKEAGVDAIILWDVAVLDMAKEMGFRIHLSTQASVSNREAVKFWARLGVNRIILARECRLDDIRHIIEYIRLNNINCEIETFIHGAMCVSISGRCFLSLYSFNKSANQGKCLQPCRREFLIRDIDAETEYIIGHDYILSPKDLCTIEFIDKLIEVGISSFKIEGRMRSPEYIKITTAVYREAIDAYYEGRLNDKLKASLKDRLATVYNRGFSEGFFFGLPDKWRSDGLAHTYEKVFVGEVARFFKKISVAEVKIRNLEIAVGENIIIIGKKTVSDVIKVEQMQQNHRFIKKAAKGEIVGIKLPIEVRPRDKIFLWRKKYNF